MLPNWSISTEGCLVGYSKADSKILLLRLLLPELLMHGRHYIWCLGKEHHTAGIHVQAMERMWRLACEL